MNKIEFSDINKFFTSIGLLLIGLAIFLPWFINQNSDILFFDKENLNTLSPESIAIITKQQNYLLFLSNSLSWLIPILLFLGLSLLCYGLWYWKKRQKVIDQIQDEELKSRKQQNLTKQEVMDSKESEIEETKPRNIKSEVQEYIQIEDRVYSKLLPYYQANYDVSQNIRMGNFDYDVILKSKNINVRADIIFEIKYSKGKILFGKLLQFTRWFILSINQYENTLQRRVIPILVIIHQGEINDELLSDYKEKLKNYSLENGRSIRIKFFNENEIDKLPHTALLEDN